MLRARRGCCARAEEARHEAPERRGRNATVFSRAAKYVLICASISGQRRRPMPHAMRITEYGGPEKLRWEQVQVGDPGPGQVRVRNTAVGLNFVDTYQRSGLYQIPLPFTLGSEGAGVVEAVGPQVKEFKKGDRVAYAGPIGAYAEVVLRPADRLVKIPAGMDDKVAAAIML